MPRRAERPLTAAVTAAVTATLLAAVGVGVLVAGGDASAVAADSPAVQTPTPLLAPLPPGGPAPATSVPPDAASTATNGGAGFGAVGGSLVGPVFDEIRVAAALSVENAGPGPAAPGHAAPGPAAPVPATALEPGGGSSSSPTPWQPRADIRVPTAVTSGSGGARTGTPRSKDEVIWAAYASAAAKEGSCHLPVMLLAAIGEVESSTLRGRTLDAAHDAVPPVVGPALTGRSFAAIRDSDHGVWDGDPVWDHAVGPMQFIPATWRIWGADGNGDGVKDPQNVEDAALAAAGYLCAGGRDLSRPADLQAAVLSYNHSQQYLATVLGIVSAVDSGQLAGP
ncbi:lytic transglycosylase domain-containing protein [Terrabacter sp. BE26]|uniref:lytic transglycosylase domain-containing protein n=1 Tax=Terrabacter sp. BE26 TaxID=2898152 RepID=UPI0035BE34C6